MQDVRRSTKISQVVPDVKKHKKRVIKMKNELRVYGERYQVKTINLIGKGSFGEIYLAKDSFKNKLVVAKIVKH